MRRALAGIGARATARSVAPPRTLAHAPARPRPDTSSVQPQRPAAREVPALAAALGGASGPVPPTTARAVGPVSPAAARAAALAPAASAAFSSPPVTATARRASPLPAGATRRPGRALAAALRTQRRARVPWTHLPRVRLAAAWEAAQRAHGSSGGSLSLVGVYGPLPLAAVDHLALQPDGRIAVSLAPLRGAGAAGDVALARSEPGGRLLRCDLPYPAHGRGIRRTR